MAADVVAAGAGGRGGGGGGIDAGVVRLQAGEERKALRRTRHTALAGDSCRVPSAMLGLVEVLEEVELALVADVLVIVIVIGSVVVVVLGGAAT